MQNRQSTMNITKNKLYSTFQLLSLSGMLVLAIGLLFAAFALINNNVADTANPDVPETWIKVAINAVTFKWYGVGDIVLAGILIYAGIAAHVCALLLLFFSFIKYQKSLYDQLFLMFCVVPILANIFAFFAQLSLGLSLKYTEAKVMINESELNMLRDRIAVEENEHLDVTKNYIMEYDRPTRRWLLYKRGDNTPVYESTTKTAVKRELRAILQREAEGRIDAQMQQAQPQQPVQPAQVQQPVQPQQPAQPQQPGQVPPNGNQGQGPY